MAITDEQKGLKYAPTGKAGAPARGVDAKTRAIAGRGTDDGNPGTMLGVERLGTISYLLPVAVSFCIHVYSGASTHSAEPGRPSMNNDPLRRVSPLLAFVARMFHTDIMERTVLELRQCDDAPSI